MNAADEGLARGEGDPSPAAIGLTWAAMAFWGLGLVATAYLVVQGFGIAFLTLVFVNYNDMNFEWRKVAEVAVATLPLCTFTVVGYVGLRHWPRRGLLHWSLAALVLQTAAAAALVVVPDGLLKFGTWVFRLSFG